MFYLEEHPPKVTIVWETNWEEERLLGQTACSHAGVPRPAALPLPAARHLLACSQIVHYNHQEEVFPSLLPSQPVNLLTTMIPAAAAAAATTAFVTSQRTEDALLSPSSSRTHLSLSRFQV